MPGDVNIMVAAAAFVGEKETWLEAVSPGMVTLSVVPEPVVKLAGIAALGVKLCPIAYGMPYTVSPVIIFPVTNGVTSFVVMLFPNRTPVIVPHQFAKTAVDSLSLLMPSIVMLPK